MKNFSFLRGMGLAIIIGAVVTQTTEMASAEPANEPGQAIKTETTKPHKKVRGAPKVVVAQPSVSELKQIIAREAHAQGVPPKLAEAIVQHESRFQVNARAEGNTIGLMQIKYGTARGMGFKGSVSELFLPENNLHYGIAYLAKAYELAKGDHCGTLTRYAGGFGVTRPSKEIRAFCSMANSYMKANGEDEG